MRQHGKGSFGAFLEQRAADSGVAFVPFDIDADYRRYDDAKPRYVPRIARDRIAFRRTEDTLNTLTVRAPGQAEASLFYGWHEQSQT